MNDDKREAATGAIPDEDGELVVGNVDGLDAAWSWDDEAAAPPPPLPLPAAQALPAADGDPARAAAPKRARGAGRAAKQKPGAAPAVAGARGAEEEGTWDEAFDPAELAQSAGAPLQGEAEAEGEGASASVGAVEAEDDLAAVDLVFESVAPPAQDRDPGSVPGSVLERHRRQVAQLLEDGQRYRAIHSLLSATSMACLDRALVLRLSSLSRELSLRTESAEAMELAFDEGVEVEGVLLCLLASRLFCEEQLFDRARSLLHKGLAQWPGDARLDRRLLFVTLRSEDCEQVIGQLKQRIERARLRGDRRAAARLSQWLGHLFETRLADHFKAAECQAKAAALYKATKRPLETYRAQRAALVCLSQIAPPPRQLAGAVKALHTTARAASQQADAEALLAALGLAASKGGPAAPPDAAAGDVFQRAIERAGEVPLAAEPLPEEQQTRPIRRRKSGAAKGAAALADSTTPATPNGEAPPAATDAQKQTRAQPQPQPHRRELERERAKESAPPSPPANGRFLSFFLEAEQDDLSRQERRERHRLERAASEEPFAPGRYRELSAYYERHHRAPLALLISDVADALEGNAAERPAPPLTLNDEDWRQCLHPAMGAVATELGALIGPAVCEVCADPLERFQPRGTFSMDGSDGAWSLADALLSAVRVLGVRVGELHLCREAALPIAAVGSTPPALLISKPLLKKSFSSAELRFFSGRALAALRPELGMFLLIPAERTEAALAGLRRALNREGRMS